jgi:hypothetical protein
LDFDRKPCELPQEYQEAYLLAKECNLVHLIESKPGKRLLQEYDRTVRNTIHPDYRIERYGAEFLNILRYHKKDSVLSKILDDFGSKFQKLVSSCNSCEQGLRILCRAMMASAHQFDLIRPMKPSAEAISKFSERITV